MGHGCLKVGWGLVWGWMGGVGPGGSKQRETMFRTSSHTKHDLCKYFIIVYVPCVLLWFHHLLIFKFCECELRFFYLLCVSCVCLFQDHNNVKHDILHYQKMWQENVHHENITKYHKPWHNKIQTNVTDNVHYKSVTKCDETRHIILLLKNVILKGLSWKRHKK